MNAAVDVPWRSSGRHGAACVIVRFRLTPKSSNDAVEGIEITPEGSAFKARVRAAPEQGKANAALAKLIAEWLGVAKSAVCLVAGDKSRVKSFAIGGDRETIESRLRAKWAEAQEQR